MSSSIHINASSTVSKNLNDYTVGGFYYCSSNDNEARYVSNLPETGKSFFLLVEDWGDSNYTKQTVTHYNSNKTYTRIKDAGTWGAWKEISANTTYTASNAEAKVDNYKSNGIAGTSTEYSRADHQHTRLYSWCTGGVSTACYVNILEFSVNQSWNDRPITLMIQQRAKQTPSYLSIKLTNTDISSANYSIDTFVVWGTNTTFYLRQVDTNKWNLMAYKAANDGFYVLDLFSGNGAIQFSSLNTSFGTTAPTNTTTNPLKTSTYIAGATPFGTTANTVAQGNHTHNSYVNPTIADNLTTNNASQVLSAKQGYILNNQDAEYVEGTHGTTATGSWTGTCTRLRTIQKNSVILFKMTSAGSGNASLTLTLADGSTFGPKDVYYNASTRFTTHLPQNTVLNLVYDGTKWINTGIQNTNNYDRVYGVYHILAGEKLTKNGLIACKKSDGKYYNIKANLAIDPTKPILWTGAEIASGGDSNNLYSAYPSVNIQTTVSGKTVTTKKRVFIEGDYTYNDGIFTISGNVFKSEDNLGNAHYIPIGASSSTTNLRFNNFDNNVYLNNTQESMFIPLSQEYNAIYHRPSSYTPSSHTHGNIDNSGILKISNTAQTNKPLITNSSGTIIAGAFGTSSGQFAEGNHTHTVPSYTLVQTIGPKNGVTAKIYTDDRNVYIKYSGTASLTANTNLNLGTVNDAYRPKTGYEYGLIGHVNANIYGAVEISGTLYIINKTTTTSASVYGSIIYPLKSRLP